MANVTAIEEDKVKEMTTIVSSALPEMEENLNAWSCTNCNCLRSAKKKRCGKCSHWDDRLRSGLKKSEKGSQDTKRVLSDFSTP